MRKIYTGAVCILICIVLTVSNRVHAEDFKFITLEVAPWAYIDDKKNTFVGIFPEIVEEMRKRTEHNIKITLTPYARINRELAVGRQDCTMLIKENKRDDLIVLGELVFNHPMGVIANKNIKLEKYEDLYGITISVLRALTITEQFSNDTQLKKEDDTDYEMGLKKIQHGRLDAIAGALPTIQYLAKKHGLDDLLGEPLQLSSEPIYLQCSLKSDKLHLLDELNKAIKTIREDGTLDSILAKYS